MTLEVARPLALPGYQEIPVDLLDPSPTNPRKRFCGLAELAQSIRELGVIEPIVVRKKGADRFEIVVGERRWRSSILAQKTTIPCVVRDLDTSAAHDVQIAENLDRDDVTPLEEADAIRVAVELHGRSIEAIADKLGKTPGYVASRLTVARSSEALRTLLDEDLVTLPAAVTLAHAPATILDSLIERTRTAARAKGEPLTRRDISPIIDRYARLLSAAPFALDEAKLTRLNARACTVCPDRTGAQAELFTDVACDDRCLDSECWEAKVAGLWERTLKDAKKRKLRVLDDVYEGNQTGYYESKLDAYQARVQRPWRDLADPAELVVGRDHRGRILELVSPETIARIVAEHRPDLGGEPEELETETDEERNERIARHRAAKDRDDLARAWTARRAEAFARIDEDGASDVDIVRILAGTCRVTREHELRMGLIEPGAPSSGAALRAWLAAPERTIRDLAKFLVADALVDTLFGDEETLDGLLPEKSEAAE